MLGENLIPIDYYYPRSKVFLGISSDWKSTFFVENFSFIIEVHVHFLPVLNNFFRQCMPYLNGSEMGARASTFAS